MSNSTYYSYILSLIKTKIKPVYDDGLNHIINDKNPTDFFKLWPRLDLYEEFMNNIVYVGSKTPNSSIKTILFLASKKNENENLKNIFNIEKGNNIQQCLYDMLIYFIFADSIVQLIPYGPMDDSRLNLSLSITTTIILKEKFEDKVAIFKQLLNRLIRQCSVIKYKSELTADHYDSNISNLISTLNDPVSLELPKDSRNNLLILNRYLEIPEPQKKPDIQLYFILKILEYDIQQPLEGDTLNETLKAAILQLPKNNYTELEKKLEKDNQKTLKKFRSILHDKMDFEALYMARNTETTINDIANFLRSHKLNIFNASEQNKNIYLWSFLYLLRDPRCKPLKELWEYGSRKDNYFLIEEKNGLSKINESQDITFIKLFFDYIPELKSTNTELLTKIIFNLLSRKIEYIQDFAQYLLDPKRKPDENIEGSFFNALTIILDPKSGFDVSEKLSQIIDQLKEFIQNKYKTNLPNISQGCSYFKTVSVQSCPESLLAGQNVDPQISGDNNQANNEIFSTAWQIKTYLITILFHIFNGQDSNPNFFVPLIKMGLGNCKELSHFALYALQVFFIKKEFARFSILNAINEVMKQETIGNKNAFTLLNLLNHFLKLSLIKIDNDVEVEKNWLQNWSNETQAILLAHLTSQYIQVREMTLIVMEHLDTLLSSLGIEFTIVSLLHKYDRIMLQRIGLKLKLTGYSTESLEKMNFMIICRSSNIHLFSYVLIEYAQLLARSNMKGVLESFYAIKLWEKINVDNLTKQTDLWNVLPIISLTQRICPMLQSTKDIINQNFNFYSAGHSLLDYEIYKDQYATDKHNDMIKALSLICDETIINKLCESMRENDHTNGFEILGAISSSLSIELFPTFIKSLIAYFKRIKKSKIKKDDATLQKRLSKIINQIVLSSDFDIFVSVYIQKNSISEISNSKDLYSELLDWYHKIIQFYENQRITFDFMHGYYSCVYSLSHSLLVSNNNGIIGAVRSIKRPPWFTDDSIFDIKIRQQCFKCLYHRLSKEEILDPREREKAEQALLGLIESLPIFNSEYSINYDIYRFLIELENKNSNAHALHSIIAQHPSLLNQYLDMSIHMPIDDGYYLFRALCELFTYNNRDVNVDDLMPDDIEANKKVIEFSGELILSSLIFIGSPHEDCRRNAYSLLKRVLPIMCAFQDKDNIRTTGNINSYLYQHQSELSVYSIEPTKEQVFEFASYIAENMQFVIPKVFVAFSTFFDLYEKQDDNDNRDIKISIPYVPLLLNVVAPFARYLVFKIGSPVFPSDFHNQTSKKETELINDLLKIYPFLMKNDIPFYVKIFGEMCYEQDNIPGLAKLLIMNFGAHNDDKNLLDATTKIILHLIQNSNPAVFLSLLVQRFSFGYWFTDKYGSKELLTHKPYKLFDWMELTLNILHEVALANFSLLFPYIHTILHYCIIFNNQDQSIHSKLSLLLQIIINNIDNELFLPEDCIIGFQSKATSDLIPVSGIIRRVDVLTQLISTSIKAWKNEALQWQTSCGDLTLSERSAIVYSLLRADPNPTDNDKIIKSLTIFLNEYEHNFNLIGERTGLFFGYIHGVLQMLLSNIKYTIENDSESIHDILQLLMILINVANVDEETSQLALKIIKIIIDKRPSELPDSNFYPLSRLIAVSFNNPNIIRIFTKKILAEDSRENQKMISLGLLLPFFYAAISAFQSISPYSVFVSKHLVDILLKGENSQAYSLCNATFPEGSKFAQIFQKYFKSNNSISLESISPLDFISEIINELWRCSSDYIPEIFAYYKIILHKTYSSPVIQTENEEENTIACNAIREAIFSVVQAFIQTVPESWQENIIQLNSIMNIAILENSAASRNLLLADVVASKLIEEPQKIDDFNPSIVEDLDSTVHEMIVNIKTGTQNNEYVTDFANNSCVDFSKSSLPVMMICDDLPKHYNNQIEAFKGCSFQPFEEQMSYWDRIQKEKFTAKEVALASNITALEFYTHANAKNVTKKTTDEIFASRDFDEDAFILKDDEFDSYEKRLKK